MVAEHSAALTRGQAIFASIGITPTQNATSNFLAQMNQQAVAQLSSLTGAQFDLAYMQTQVMMHQTVLTTIQQVLLPSARTPQMRNFLQVQAAEVQGHLVEAQQIVDDLQ
jgi:putative membrane protein